MTGREAATLFGGKRIGKGRWIALCTAHPDRKPSLSISEGKRAVLLRCQSQQCDVKDICRGAGIEVKALWYQQTADPKAIREAERRRQAEENAEELIKRYRRIRDARLWRWYRVTTALGWLLMRHPHDDTLAACFEHALSRIREAPASWPLPVAQEAPYSPFQHRKLLHGIKAHQVTPQIAKYLKLPQKAI